MNLIKIWLSKIDETEILEENAEVLPDLEVVEWIEDD